MIFNYDDEERRLSERIRTYVERATQLAITSELDLAADDEIDAEISITVVSADEIKEINCEYRGIDKVTDVLSFPQYNDAEEFASDLENSPFAPILGDVVLCYDQAIAQAEEYGTGIDRELVYLTTHSVLHLLGYDHMEDDEKQVMRSREEEIMTAIGLAR